MDRKRLDPIFKNLVNDLSNEYTKNNYIPEIKSNDNYKILKKEYKPKMKIGVELLIEEILFK